MEMITTVMESITIVMETVTNVMELGINEATGDCLVDGMDRTCTATSHSLNHGAAAQGSLMMEMGWSKPSVWQY